MAAATYRDDPWRRLPWLLPAACVLALLSLMGFLALLSGPPYRPKQPTPIQAEMVELPAPAPPAPAAPPAPSPPPHPTPPPVAQEPPPPPPEPMPEVKPPPAPVPERKPPPKPQPRPRPVHPPKPRVAPAPVPPAPTQDAVRPPAPATPAPSHSAPGGGNMGARAIYRPMPELPEELRRHALDVVAVARFHVAPTGAVEIELIQPTPDPTLNRVLLDTLRRWRFFPAMDDGKPIASTIDVRIPITVK